MKNIYFLVLLAGIIAISACENRTAISKKEVNNDNLLIATLYHQKSAERDALCLQAYNMAKYRLDDILAENPDSSKLAIVLDLDETVLDNSPYEAKCILRNISYPTGWDEWMHAACAKELPGAVEFLEYVKSKGVSIFYITNRREKYKNATMQNLQKLGIAPVSEAHLLLRTDESSKEPRRQKVLEGHKIIMLFGDNLADFTKVFDGKKSVNERLELVISLKDEFGDRFIVFPNTMYGDWLNAVIDHNFNLSPAAKIEKQKNELQGF